MIFKKIDRRIKFVIFVLALGATGFFLQPLLKSGIKESESLILQIAGPLSMFLVSVALFIEIYIYDRPKENNK